MRKLFSVVLLSSVLLVTSATAAQAAPVLLGDPLTGTFEANQFALAFTFGQPVLPGATTVSPVSGTIIRWRMIDGASPYQYKLRVLAPVNSEPTFLGAGTSAAETPAGPGVETFATDMPIAAGQLIGLDVEQFAPIGARVAPQASYFVLSPPIADGATETAEQSTDRAIGFDAEVLPPPTISLLGTTTGPPAGGTSVTIAGSNFAEVEGVSFGSIPASSFTVDSDGLITAVSPAGVVGSVPITITTIAGTVTSAQQFAYAVPTVAAPVAPSTPTAVAQCKVPKLTGKTLAAAKKSLRAADCKPGKVTKKKTAKAKVGKVVAQGKKAGAALEAGTAVKLTVGKR